MTMEIGGAGDAGVAGRIEDVVKGFGETRQVILDIVQELEEFKEATDKEIREATLQRIQEDLERLHSGAGNVQGIMSRSLENIQNSLDSARISGSQGEAEALNQIQARVDELRQQLGGTPV
ncbi:MAG: hypothetical protein KJ811_01195 [Candidatus Margulisbacteria bacterium]|nr:hypothetical protein [Candidatus Margulisiibacteriota bacterium]